MYPQTLTESTVSGRVLGPAWRTRILLLAFSVFYFLDVCLRASQKYFWYDELNTLDFSRLPNFHLIWQALNSGVDFNPPFFYLFTRACEWPVGGGLIATRLPEILGFWIFCLCLFRFVNKRVGPWSGAVAMLLPMLTGAFYYAYEARPHGIVIGFAGLSLVCWQMANDRPHSLRWVGAFGLALLGAFMMHCYALTILAPFGLTECFVFLKYRRMRWGMWLAMVIPAVAAILMYIPLLRSYKKWSGGTNFSSVDFPPNWLQVNNFYVFLLAPCIFIVLIAALVFAVERLRAAKTADDFLPSQNRLPIEEIVLTLIFVALPVFGVLLGKIVHGPFFARYFISALAGVSILLAAGLGSGERRRTWGAVGVVSLMVCLLGFSLLKLAWHTHNKEYETLVEPSTNLTLETTPGDPLSGYPSFTHGSTQPIIVLHPIEFLYLAHYAPRLLPELYYADKDPEDFSFRGLRNLLPWSMDKYNLPLTFGEIMRKFPAFSVYADPSRVNRIPLFIKAGAKVTGFHTAGEHVIVDLQGPGDQAR